MAPSDEVSCISCRLVSKDPLIDNSSAIAEEMNPITWEVDFIWDTRRQEMQLTSSDGNLNATVKGIDDQWMIDCFCF